MGAVAVAFLLAVPLGHPRPTVATASSVLANEFHPLTS